MHGMGVRGRGAPKPDLRMSFPAPKLLARLGDIVIVVGAGERVIRGEVVVHIEEEQGLGFYPSMNDSKIVDEVLDKVCPDKYLSCTSQISDSRTCWNSANRRLENDD